MIAQIAPWIGVFTIFSVVIGVGWWQIRKSGALKGKLEQTEDERDAAIREAELAARPPLSGAQSLSVLRQLLARQKRNR